MNDSQKIDDATAFVKANIGAITEAIQRALSNDSGEALCPFVLLLPTSEGTQMIGNLPSEQVAYLLHATANSIQLETAATLLAESGEVRRPGLPPLASLLAVIFGGLDDDADETDEPTGPLH